MKNLLIILFFAITLPSQAQLTWTTQITANNSSEFASKLIKTQDGGYVTVLNKVDTVQNIPQNIEYNKIAIVKLDANGNIVFNKKINIRDSSTVRISDFIELATGELLMSGVIFEKQNGGPQGSLLLKTSALGDTLWTVYTVGNLGCNSSAACLNLIDFNTKFWTTDAIITGQFDTLNYFIYEYDYNGTI